MIAWKYINKNSAVIAAIRDYHNMRFIINNTPEEIKEVYGKMSAPRRSGLTGSPSAHSPKSGEDKLVAQLDKLDLLRERYSSAVEYMAWFEPAWSSMTDTEQHILGEFYMGDSQKSGATYRLMGDLNYGERKIEQMRSNALKHLCTMLYG